MLGKLNEDFIERLEGVNQHLSPLFSKFASKFLGVSCELVISMKLKARKPITYMYPRFNEKERSSVSEVSESQRFFIDQAFRMALITLFFQYNQDCTTFFIVETPEGSLDLAYERNVAEMYFDFAKYGHSILVTSNLNSSNFLQGLYEQLGTKAVQDDTPLSGVKVESEIGHFVWPPEQYPNGVSTKQESTSDASGQFYVSDNSATGVYVILQKDGYEQESQKGNGYALGTSTNRNMFPRNLSCSTGRRN